MDPEPLIPWNRYCLLYVDVTVAAAAAATAAAVIGLDLTNFYLKPNATPHCT